MVVSVKKAKHTVRYAHAGQAPANKNIVVEKHIFIHILYVCVVGQVVASATAEQELLGSIPGSDKVLFCLGISQ